MDSGGFREPEPTPTVQKGWEARKEAYIPRFPECVI